MKIDRSWIQAHIPHQGNMCLLHAAERWDSAEIVCSAVSHLAPDNPLRNALGLPITAGIEYAAQAMAVHGALLAPPNQTPDIGYLTSVRNVLWTTARLDDAAAPLRIQATRVSGNEISLLYDFSIHCEDRLLLSGRAGVMIKPPTPLTTP
ncbi:3-hydroxylacyl-ACP dehydratase [Rhodoferax saidenbachensis]|uniref:Hotdog family 3-hydroxylacyl-ACP dehydratase n=1 Tax=Rhodoferax saidenbachensis TaxID=1484693 RepID=A0ABU1ZKL9_9BURK|nr:3-hydroxylacyl-ACP dehydratase [Rhodoferax saidenbachensis]MDR7306096.1 putative hotdog family 3-hydroxylacyl-ACP dehydratase [Rhodoferax saidenbachensis]